MAFRPIVSLRGTASGFALVAALAVAITIGASGSTGLVQSSFDQALTTRDAPSALAASAKPAGSIPLAQSEEFWLRGNHSKPSDVKPVAWTGQLSRGDRITIAQSGSAQARVLEVVETAPVAMDATRLDAGEQASQLIAVSCRDVSQPDAPLLRLIVSEGALPFAVSRGGDKAL